jgi:hypothetical protein
MESSIKRGLFMRIPGSIKAWAGLVGYLVVVKYILASLPPLNVKAVTSDFAWSTIVLFGMIGSVGILLSMVTGFPDALAKAISNRQRFVIPVLAGAGLGILAILIDQITQGTKFIEMQSGEASFMCIFRRRCLCTLVGLSWSKRCSGCLPSPSSCG